LNRNSDAALFYFPGTLKFLSGQVPYRDFNTSYSVLFYPFISSPVFLWRSLGAIVLSMLLIETVMIFTYLYRSYKKDFDNRWIVAFLYCFSPISFYWVAMTGYNGVIITLFVMLALIFAEDGKAISTSISMALSFLCCKLLAILAWPGIIFYTHRAWMKMMILPAMLLTFLALLPLISIDILLPIKLEFFQTTSGNLWYLVSIVFPGLKKSWAWQVLPILSFAVAFMPLFILYLREHMIDTEDRFDRATAFIATTNLLFMIFSKKSYTFYMPMMLIFIIHTIVRNNRYTIKHLIPLSFLGATTTVEPYLYQNSRYIDHMILFILDIMVVGCYMYLAIICFIISLPSLNPTLISSRGHEQN
jgi:hypothetical protein